MMAAAALMTASLALGGCAYDDYGYGGVNVGYGVAGGYGYDGYGYPAYGYGGIGYGSGWYNDFYYPGTGYYVFDRSGRRSRWNDGQRRYWQQRQAYRGERRDDRRDFRQERRDDRRAFRQGDVSRDQFRQDRRADRQDFRQDRRQDRQQFRNDTGRPAPRPNITPGPRREGGLVGRVQRRVEQQR
jgi:hypothetical protein